MSSESRARVIDRISKIVGFKPREEDLPPKLRKEIGQIAKKEEHYNWLVNLINKSEKDKILWLSYTICISIIGLTLFLSAVFPQTTHPFLPNFLWIGPVFLVFAFIVFRFFFLKYRTRANQKRVEAIDFRIDLDKEIKQLSKAVYNELSSLHEAKVRPTVRHIVIDFARIIQAARGKGIVLTSIECPHCNGVVEIPPTGEYFKCQHCGKTIHATKIFDKLKDLLGLS
ncbi:hypothetical protein IBX38_06545 [Candidatus Bathyarchaeota archaeon]|nr:hypothetical protein [Candidatus Bathyarchaeota archaeon]